MRKKNISVELKYPIKVRKCCATVCASLRSFADCDLFYKG